VLLRWLARLFWILPAALLTLARPARAENIFTSSDPAPASAASPPASGLGRPARSENIFTSSDPSPESAASTPASSGWYGWQILLADTASITLVFAGGARSDAAVTAGLAGWIGAGPAVHLAHGDVGKGALSLALRLGLPLLGAWAGSRIAGCAGQSGDNDECGGPAALGGLFGVLAAETIDDGWLANGGAVGPPSETARPPTPPDGFPVGLMLAPRNGGAVAGYCGHF
jgi:hypothetical protein